MEGARAGAQSPSPRLTLATQRGKNATCGHSTPLQPMLAGPQRCIRRGAFVARRVQLEKYVAAARLRLKELEVQLR